MSDPAVEEQTSVINPIDVEVDERHLMTVRVVSFELSAGTSDQFDIAFQLEADKTRAIRKVLVNNYGRNPQTPFSDDDTSSLMTTYDMYDDLKSYDQIKHDAWKVVETTTNDNKSGGGGTHADIAWEEIVEWVKRETEKPSTTATLNI